MSSQNRQPTIDDIRRLLAELDPASIWRPVLGPDGTRIAAAGDGREIPELDAYIGNLELNGKTVADLGCNLGYFAFLAKRRGAGKTLGLDIDPDVVRVASAIARLHDAPDVTFVACDFLRVVPETPCDLAMLIDFIGRQIIAKGRVRAVVAAARNWASREIFFTLRPVYALDDLPVSRETLESLYPGFVHDDAFYLAEFVAHELGPRWSLACLPNGSFAVSPTQRRFKAALLFTKIPD
ncbi:MAG TPA: methyltransferase domain-containing protein [Solidesulfovibrio magneticus]|nr:methyltransferase domain-containing protein [Solidesulfovibrio magneticus]